jgi:DNA-binding MarR family transcriptional regulator
MPPKQQAVHAVATSIDAFRRILRALRLAATRTQMSAGLSAAQLFVLRAVQDGVEASLSEIADRTMTDRSSVASVVDRLLAAGLVVRGTSSADRRRAAVTITPHGRTVLRRAPAPPTTLLVAGLEQLSREQLERLAEGLVALTDAMGLSEQAPGMLFDDADGPATRRTGRRAIRR